MLTYQFRGRSDKDKQWKTGSLIVDKNGECAILEPKDYAFQGAVDGIEYAMPMTVNVIKVDAATIGIHSGLFDKDGKDIYEGDILEDGKERYAIQRDSFTPALTAISDFAWTMHRQNAAVRNTAWLHANAPHMRVVGNIHDNPELMEVKIPGKKT